MKRQIIITKDGSHTVEIPELRVAYHSHNGALQESMHVFIEAGLRFVAGATGHTGQATSQTLASMSELASGPTSTTIISDFASGPTSKPSTSPVGRATEPILRCANDPTGHATAQTPAIISDPTGQATTQTLALISDLASGPTSTTSSTLRIFEMGFGTGLNAYLTAQEAHKLQVPVHYTVIEPYPLSPEEITALNYAATEADCQLFSQLHQAPWQKDVSITPLFTLRKEQAELFQFNIAVPVHLIYYDAFAPSAQPELWTESTFRQLHRMLVPGGVLVTYCSKSVVRRAMQAAGFIVTKIQGPRGKREMVRAFTPNHPLSP